MKNDNIFDFEGNDIYSSSSKVTKNVEDIVSDSRYLGSGRHYAKARRKKSAFGKIADWWRGCRKWQRVTMTTLASLVLVAGIGVGAIRILFDYNYNDITNNPEDLGFENVINSKVVNVALFGIDAREEKSFSGRSDSIMILSLNTETKKVKVISVMRDTLAPITYEGKTTYGKINGAYAKGGPELAIKTLNEMFKLDISEYATVNFYGMSDIIDAVDGIDVTLTEKELNVEGFEDGHKVNYGINGMIQEQCSYMNIDPAPYYIIRSGEQHLNGIQAVAYARIRHAANAEGTNNDQGRTDRQRYVMEQLFNKAVTLSKAKYVKLAKALIPCSETSLSYTEIMGLAVNVLLHSPTFEQTRVPLADYQMPSPSSVSGSYIYFDKDYASKIIKSFIYDDIKPEDYIAANGVEKNDWFGKRGSSGGTSGNSSGTTKNPGTTSTYSKPDDMEDDDESDIIDSSSSSTGSSSSSSGSSSSSNSSSSSSGSSSSSSSSNTSSDTSTGDSSGDSSSSNPSSSADTSGSPSTPAEPSTPSSETPAVQE